MPVVRFRPWGSNYRATATSSIPRSGFAHALTRLICPEPVRSGHASIMRADPRHDIDQYHFWVCRKSRRSSLTAVGERPSTRRKVRFMWLWSQNPASSAMELSGWSVSRTRRVARSTRNRAAVSCSPSPVECQYADPTHDGCRCTSIARSLIFRVVSSLRRRLIVPIQFAGARSGSRLAPSRNRWSAARS